MSISFRPRVLAVSLIIALSLALTLAVGSDAQTSATPVDIYDFGASIHDGRSPMSGLTQATDGNLYGTTYSGGNFTIGQIVVYYGTIYQIAPSTSGNSLDQYTSLYHFQHNGTDGTNPFAPMIEASDTNLYGTTVVGGGNGFGTVFQFPLSGSADTIVHSFTNNDGNGNDEGAYPYGAVVENPTQPLTLVGTTADFVGFVNNNFSATPPYGPDSAPYGTLYSVTTSGGNFTPLAFDGTDGAVPLSDLQIWNGLIYGSTWAGGTNNNGTLFWATNGSSITPIWTTFNPADGGLPLGSQPTAPPYVDPFGNILAPLQGGGNDDGGSIAQISYNYTQGNYVVDWEDNFEYYSPPDGASPYGPLLLASDGNFYGLANQGGGDGNDGVIFEIVPQNPLTGGGTMTSIYNFQGSSTDGARPYGSLLLANNGYIYGTTSQGGANGYGDVFKFDLTPNITSLSPPDAAQGDPQFTLTVNGSNFTTDSVIYWQDTSVPSSTPMTTNYVSPTQLTTTIPASYVTAPSSTINIYVQNQYSGQSNVVNFPINPPRPQITAISPTDVADDASNVTITITPAGGTTFVAGEKVTAGPRSYTNTTLDGSGNLLVTLLSTQLRGAGVLPVAAVDSYGDASNSLNLTVHLPTLTSLVPNHATQNGPGENVVVNGNWFVSSDWLAFPSIDSSLDPIASPALTETSFTVTVPPSFLGTVGPITVYAAANGSDGADFSNPLPFTVDAPPTLSSISPTSVSAGANNLTLTLTGTNFVSGDSVSVGGNLVTPTIVSATSMTAAVPATDIATAGSMPVEVVTVDGIATAAQTLTVNAPTITSLSPTSATAGAPGITLTITGTNFVSGEDVAFGSDTLTPTSLSATQIVVSVPAAALTNVGPVNVSITPAVAGGSGSTATTFNVTAAPTLTSISPTAVSAGAAAFNLTLTGTNFVATDYVNFGALQLTPTSVTATTIIVSVPQADVATTGPISVNVETVDGVTTSSQTLTVNAPTITSLSPTSATAGAPGITLTVRGTNFVSGEEVKFGSTTLAPTSLNATTIVVSVPAAQLTTVGPVNVSITPAVADGSGSTNFTFNVTNAPTLSNISPAIVSAGAATFNLTLTGANFVATDYINFGALQIDPTSVTATTMVVSIPQADVATAGSISVNVETADGVTTAAKTLTVNAPTITTLSPASATAGAPGITLTVTGTNFVSGEEVKFGSTTLAPTSLNATTIVVSVPAAQLTTVGPVNVSIAPAVAGGSGSTNFTFNVTNAPTLTSISPNSASAGTTGVSVTLTGTNFTATDTVNFGGFSVTPTGTVTATSMTVNVPQADIATAGLVNVSVQTLDGVTSNTQPFTINAPTITALSPASATAGTPGITLTVTGTNFVSGEQVKFGSTTLAPTSLNATTIVVSVPAAQLTTVGPVNISITPAVAGGSGSTNAAFNVTNAPTLTSISPAAVSAGAATFNLTLTGNNFVSGDIINFGALQLTPTSVTATTLVVSVPQADVATAGLVSVNVATVDGVITPSQTLTVNAPTITTLSPTSATAGSPGITLTVTGTNFVTGEEVKFGSTTLAPTSLNATTIVVSVPAAQLTTVGPVNISITPAVAGGSGSTNAAFNVTNAPTLTSISPAAVSAGAATFNLTLTGNNFVSGDIINFGALQLTPTSVTATTLVVSVPQADVATAGLVSVNVATVDGVITPSQTLTVNAPTITTLSPTSATAGSPGITLTVTGTNFVTGEEVKFGSTTLAPTSLNATTIVVSVPAAQLTTVGPVNISITPAVAGGSGSTNATFNVTNAPTLTSISPAAVSAGAATFNLTLAGANFVSGDIINFGDLQLTPTSVTATTLVVSVPQADVATAGSISVNVATVDGVTTTSQTLSVNAPTITTLSPASATAGAPGITMTITGTNFVTGEQVNFGGTTLAPTSLSATQIVVSVPAAQLAAVGPVSVSITPAVAGGTGSSSDTFNVTNAPALIGISPNNVAAGGPAFSLTLTGTNFVNGDVVNVGPAQLTPVSLTPTTIVVNLPQIPIAAVANVNVQTVDGVITASQPLTVNAPNISGLVPGSATAGSTGISLTINGTWFTAGEQVSFGGTVLTPSTLSSTQITVTVPAALLTSAGPVSVFVTPAVVGGTGSNTATFTVTSAPTLTSLTPNNANAGGPGFTLVVAGVNFVAGDVIDWNGSPLNTTFVSASELDAAVPAADIAASGTAVVTAVTIDGSVSNGLTFTINFVNPLGNAPTITSISPGSTTAGNPGFTLTVNGTNFAAGDSVQWNGTALITTFVSATQLTAVVPATDVAVAGSQNVTVVDLLGDISNVKQFTVNPLNNFQPGLQMISAPYDYSGDDPDQVLGYSNVLFAVWEPTLASYVLTPISPADTLHQGQAAWVDIPAQGAGVQYKGTDLTASTGSMTISLPAGWSMIGDPFGQPLSLTSSSQIGIKAADGSLMTLEQANQQGLVYATLYSYDTASNTYVNHATDAIQPYQGYWFLVFEPCTLVMTSPDGNNPH